MALSHGQPGRRARSRTGPSSDDRSESEEILSRPRKGKFNLFFSTDDTTAFKSDGI